MGISNKKELLDKLAPPGISKWEEAAKIREKNQAWLTRSQDIALKVLRSLRQQQMSQRRLAELFGCSPQHVNKLVSGKENLTLETISRLEAILNIRLMSVPVFSTTMEVKMYEQKYYSTPDAHLVKQAQAIKASQSLKAGMAFNFDNQFELADENAA